MVVECLRLEEKATTQSAMTLEIGHVIAGKERATRASNADATNA